jgi:hypothetical protein
VACHLPVARKGQDVEVFNAGRRRWRESSLVVPAMIANAGDRSAAGRTGMLTDRPMYGCL